MGVVK